jgi:hypothetical protein
MLHERFPQFLEEARAVADYVVIDSAPLGEFSDALRIASEVDQLIVATPGAAYQSPNFEVMRDVLERTGHKPASMLVIGVAAHEAETAFPLAR